jgi:hypothetical protein
MNNLVAPKYIPQALEHIKQHMMLWYTNQMQTYAGGDTGVRIDNYDGNKLVKEIDKAIAIASDHVKMDSQEVFAGVMPALQQLGQFMQQFKPPAPPMDGEAQAVLQASMAETQRRAAQDQASNQLKMAELQAKAAREDKDLQARIAMNAEDNLTTERMKTAELTVDGVRLRKEQEETAIKLNQTTQSNLGER